MARDFDGANDDITFGSDASIDGFTNKTIAFWLRWDGTGVNDVFVAKANSTGTTGWAVISDAGTNTVLYFIDMTTTNGTWHGSTAVNDAAWHHIVVVHDGATGTPVMYVDGNTETITTVSTPVGTAVGDAGENLQLGEIGGTGFDFDGAVGWLCYDNSQWTAAQANRHRWWGCSGGGIDVVQPMITTDLTNKGTATANGTATGTTMTSSPKVERCYASMMGVGR